LNHLNVGLVSQTAPWSLLFNAPKMDFNSLKDSVSNLTLYDVKASIRKVQNGKQAPGSTRQPGIFASTKGLSLTCLCTAVMNYTEMEAKVLVSSLDADRKMSHTNRQSRAPISSLS
jgi:hypothetical protein